METVRARLFIIIILLTGCSSLSGTPTPRELTPAPVPETVSSPHESVGKTDTRGAQLVDRHTQQLAERPYTVSSNHTVRYQNGSLRSQTLVQVALTEDRAYRTRVETAGAEAWQILGPPPMAAVFWSNGTLYAGKYIQRNETTYTEFTPSSDGVGTWQFWAKRATFGRGSSYERGELVSLFDSIETEAVGIRSGVGTNAYRMDGTQLRSTEFAQRGVRDVHDVRLVALVVGGVVRSVELRYEATIDGEPVVVHRQIEYTGVGNTVVQRPEWIDRATSAGTEEN